MISTYFMMAKAKQQLLYFKVYFSKASCVFKDCYYINARFKRRISLVNHVDKVYFYCLYNNNMQQHQKKNNKTLNVIQTTITEVHYQDIKGN